MIVDRLFLLSILSFGFGLSLMTYRLFARSNRWSMGVAHSDYPAIPVLLGLFALGVGIAFAAARGAPSGGLIIVVAGLLLAVFWTGFLRVGSQVSLFLAPAAAIALIWGWIAIPIGY